MGRSPLDKELVLQLKSGSAAAFRTLVETHQERVINTCYRFLLSREDAEDVAQEVFLEVYKSIRDFREEAKLSTWIYRIAVTRSLDLIRKRKRKKRMSFLKSSLGLEEVAEKIPASHGGSPDSKLENRERQQVLQNALNSLADNQRTAFVLSKYEEYSYQEIADIMGTSLSAVESLIHRAKKSLQKKLANYYEKNQSGNKAV